MTDTILQRVRAWLDDPYYDVTTKAEVQKLLQHPDQLSDAFFTDLSFGTGGLRGIMGVGTNRINIYTIRKATQGLANYIKKTGDPHKGVVIGFDSRLHSSEFAREAAFVLMGNKIRVFFIPQLRPTPYISFACRHLQAQAAIMITASHNPKEYNGYKVFWQDGGQVVPPHDTGIIAEVDAISSPQQIHLSDAPVTDCLVDAAYLEAIAKLFPQGSRTSLKISYTSLHGTGITLMPSALQQAGFAPPHLVASQVVPDGNFPTVHFPNPEYPEALRAGIEDLLQTQGDLLLATDPDADRLGIAIRHNNQSVIFTGNEQAAIAAYFLCQHKPPPHPAIVTTIVTTELVKKIAAVYGVTCIEVLTGFKYIGQKIHEWEQEPNGYNFLFGAEESYGYLLGTHARDKDGIVAGCLFALIAFTMKQQGRTLLDLLHEIYERFGVFRERQFSLTFEEGKKGIDAIHHLMQSLRKTPNLAGLKVTTTQDFLKEGQGLPLSDVLLFRLEDHSKIIIRPSGTEPKLKIYLATQSSGVSVEQGLRQCDVRLDELTATLKAALQGIK